MRNLVTRLAFAGKMESAASRRVFTSARGIRASLAAATLIVASGCALAQDADVFKPPPPVTYTEKYEVYGGINFMNGQAGQTLPKRYNMGGGEAMGTWWVTPRIGAALDARFGAGTSPVLPSAQVTLPGQSPIPTRVLVTQTIGMAGVQYRGPRSQRAAINYHALIGVSHGSFDWDVPADRLANAGLYTNRTKPVGVVGGSIDFNRSARFAIRLQPDLVFEHFGTETREFFAISAGVIYRFGNRQ
jgi:hypothetical protein